MPRPGPGGCDTWPRTWRSPGSPSRAARRGHDTGAAVTCSFTAMAGIWRGCPGHPGAVGMAWPSSAPHRHRHCPGLWRGELTVGYTGEGKRQRRKVSGKIRAAVVDKLRDLHTQLDQGVTPKAGYAYYTVRQAAGDWLAHG